LINHQVITVEAKKKNAAQRISAVYFLLTGIIFFNVIKWPIIVNVRLQRQHKILLESVQNIVTF
jgi:hypothetical protein